MLTLRLPANDASQGLAEKPAPFLGFAASGLASQMRPGRDEVIPGMPASAEAAMADQMEAACRYGALVERVAARHGFLPSVIAGFCSRRSGWGLNLAPSGPGGTADFTARHARSPARAAAFPPDGLGFRRGLMGLDYDRSSLAQGPHWRDPERNIDAAFALIAACRTALRRRSTLQGNGLIRGAFTAFECGLASVERATRQGRDVDTPSLQCGERKAGCGRDVLARACYFQTQGWD